MKQAISSHMRTNAGHASRGFARLGFTLLMAAQAAGMVYLLFLMSVA